jgi:hypothetical protein
VNREHFQAFLWLRWRLRVNQFRKAGTLTTVLFFIFVVVVLIAAVGFAAIGFLVGLFVLPTVEPVVRLLVWDGVIAAFLFYWIIGLVTELQRGEGLPIDKVLHLPVSPTGAFLINYLSSLFSLTLVAFLPGMIGLILGQVCAGSAAMILALPLLAAFVLAVTGTTYQFQGWLATLMSNPRRRRTVVLCMTFGLVLIFQVPNLANMARLSSGADRSELTRRREQWAADKADLAANKITKEEYDRRVQAAADQLTEDSRRSWVQTEQVARLVSAVLPPGWLALAAADLPGGSLLPALLGTLGLGLIGTASLWRAYRTTIRLYTGQFAGSSQRRAVRPQAPADPNRLRLVERRLPWASEHASAVALATLRSWLRATEVKMQLASFVLLLFLAGGGMLFAKAQLPAQVRPFVALGAGAAMMFLCSAQLIGNQFAYDRTGFRAYVLSPVPRRSILLGKNLAAAWPVLGLGAAVFLLVGIVFPMRVDYYPAVALQLASFYLWLCLIANAMSILAPIPVAAGTMQQRQVKAGPMFLQLAFLMVLPVILLPAALPFGIEMLVELAGLQGVPVALLLSPLFLGLAVVVYRPVLTWEGSWLASREQAILEVVTSKGE